MPEGHTVRGAVGTAPKRVPEPQGCAGTYPCGPEPEDGAARAESDAGYRMLFDGNPHPMWVYDVETLAFLAVNQAAVRHYGYPRGEFLAMTIAEIRPPEDVPAVIDEVARHRGSNYRESGSGGTA